MRIGIWTGPAANVTRADVVTDEAYIDRKPNTVGLRRIRSFDLRCGVLSRSLRASCGATQPRWCNRKVWVQNENDPIGVRVSCVRKILIPDPVVVLVARAPCPWLNTQNIHTRSPLTHTSHGAIGIAPAALGVLVLSPTRLGEQPHMQVVAHAVLRSVPATGKRTNGRARSAMEMDASGQPWKWTRAVSHRLPWASGMGFGYGVVERECNVRKVGIRAVK